MITRILSAVSGSMLAFCIMLPGLFVFSESAHAAGKGDYLIQLIWGTDDEKPGDKPLKDVDPEVREKLKRVFKWKNYFEVNRGTFTASKDGAPRLKLSDKCEIELQDLTNSRIEIRLFGEGKPVLNHRQKVNAGDPIVLAGDSKNDTAWFVVLTPPK